MPLYTRIVRDGEPVKLEFGWGWWHVQVMKEVAVAETFHLERAEDYTVEQWHFTALYRTGRQVVLRDDWEFEDTSDGEIFRLHPGDVLEMWRS